MITEKLTRKTEKIFEAYLQEIRLINSNHPQKQEHNEHNIFKQNDAFIIKALQNIDWSFTENDTTYLSHDIHPYPAKFVPQLPERIIKLFSSYGEVIWDPFGGSGTTSLEALLNDRFSISTDINPLGTIIGKAKTTSLRFNEEEELENFITKLELYSSTDNYLKEYIDSHRNELEAEIPNIPNIEKWFNKIVICELAFIKLIIKCELNSESTINVAKASLSKIVTRVSNQESETRYRAIERTANIGETVRIFLKDLKENFAKVKAIGKLLGYRTGRFVTANVMEDIVGTDKPIAENEVDLIVTSPPYPNAFDYHLYHRFRIFWLDGDPREMGKVEIGSHLKYQRKNNKFEEFEIEMRPVLVNCFKALKPGRFAAFVLGDAIFDGVIYRTAERIGLVAEEVGFKYITIVNRPLPENKRSVQNGARRATDEQILVLKKPDSHIEVTLTPVKYKLWPYEKVISDLEVEALLGGKSNIHNVNSQNIDKLKYLTFYSNYKLNGTELKTWQSILEQGVGGEESNRKEPKYVTHGIHPYKGKFYPQLVRPLMNILDIPKNGIVFDPFSGSGTVVLESILNGYNAYGCDINPIAVEIAKAKNHIITVAPYELEKYIAMFKRDIESYSEGKYRTAFAPEALEEIESWFPQKVVDKMGYILEKIKGIPDEKIKCFLKVILSSIIRDISQQEPSDLRIRRRKEPIDDAPVIEKYLQNLQIQYDKVIAFHKIRNFAPEQIKSANVWKGNSTDVQQVKQMLPLEGADIVITSPPYATALPYIDTNRLNILVLNGMNASMRVPVEAEMTGTREIRKATRQHYGELIEENDFGDISSDTAKDIIRRINIGNRDADVGFRKKNMAALVYMYFNDMSRVMNTLNQVVKVGGYICIVIGDTKTTTGIETVIIKTTKVLRETGMNLGWKLANDIPISVTVEKYLHMNNSITENNILIFRK